MKPAAAPVAMTRQLHHVLLSSAARPGDMGWQAVLEGFMGTEAEGEKVTEWLQSLRVQAGARRGWAWSSFNVGGVVNAALALVEPTFGLDAHERDALLAHALLLPLPPGEAAGDVGQVLLEHARTCCPEHAGSGASWSVAQYRDLCGKPFQVEVPRLQAVRLRELPLTVLARLLNAGSQDPLPRQAGVPGRSEDDLVEGLLQAAAVLPPPLRLHVRWGVGVMPSSSAGFVATQLEPETDPIPLKGFAAVYFRWLRERLDAGAAEEILIIAERSDLISWERLAAAVGSVQALGAPTDGRSTGPGAPSAPLLLAALPEPALVADTPPETRPAAILDEEARAIEASIKDYLDRRLSVLTADLAGAGRESSEVSAPEGARKIGTAEVSAERAAGIRSAMRPAARSIARWVRQWRAEVYLLVVLALMGAIWRRLPVRPEPRGGPPSARSSGSPVASTPKVQAQPGVAARPATNLTSGTGVDDPLNEWEIFVQQKPELVAVWLARAANGKGLKAKQVPVRQKQQLVEWAKAVSSGMDLSRSDLKASAIGLFEYIYALWARAHDFGDPKRDVIRFDGRAPKPHLKKLVESLHLTVGPTVQVDDLGMQVAVVESWLESRGSP